MTDSSMQGSLSWCARDYAKKWEAKGDKALFDGLDASQTFDTRLHSLKRLCGDYSVARNLKRARDVGAGYRRFEPLLSALDECRVEFPTISNVEDTVGWFVERVRSSYEANALSAATKVLWFSYRSPVIIYDKLARTALGVPAGNYPAYVSRWKEWYAEQEETLDKATSGCRHGSQQWFKDRVFDLFLYFEGKQNESQRKRRRFCG